MRCAQHHPEGEARGAAHHPQGENLALPMGELAAKLPERATTGRPGGRPYVFFPDFRIKRDARQVRPVGLPIGSEGGQDGGSILQGLLAGADGHLQLGNLAHDLIGQPGQIPRGLVQPGVGLGEDVVGLEVQ